MIRIYEANAMFGGKETELYKCWKYLLDNPDLKPKDLFDVFPKLSYIHLKQGVDEGALVKNGRSYSANPDFQFKGISRTARKPVSVQVEEPVEEPIIQEPVKRNEPSMQKIGNMTRFTIDEDEFDEEFFSEEDVMDMSFRDIIMFNEFNSSLWANKANNTKMKLKDAIKYIVGRFYIEKPKFIMINDKNFSGRYDLSTAETIVKNNSKKVIATYVGPRCNEYKNAKEALDYKNWDFNFDVVKEYMSK